MLIEVGEHAVTVRLATKTVTVASLAVKVISVEPVDDRPDELIGRGLYVEDVPVILVVNCHLKIAVVLNYLVRHDFLPESRRRDVDEADIWKDTTLTTLTTGDTPVAPLEFRSTGVRHVEERTAPG
jgi:hypothetical protein